MRPEEGGDPVRRGARRGGHGLPPFAHGDALLARLRHDAGLLRAVCHPPPAAEACAGRRLPCAPPPRHARRRAPPSRHGRRAPPPHHGGAPRTPPHGQGWPRMWRTAEDDRDGGARGKESIEQRRIEPAEKMRRGQSRRKGKENISSMSYRGSNVFFLSFNCHSNSRLTEWH